MDPSLAKYSRTLEESLKSLSNVRGKGDSSSCKYGKAHLKGSFSEIAFRVVAHTDDGKKVLETLDVASTKGNCKREERARGTSPSFVHILNIARLPVQDCFPVSYDNTCMERTWIS